MNNYEMQSLQENLLECQKHCLRINAAKKHISAQYPITIDSYHEFNEVDESFIDQLVYRFSKLQDSLGEKIFPLILTLSQENIKRKTFIDILNRLEELEVVNKNNWLLLRELRNNIAHEYSFNVEEVVNSINLLYKESSNLIKVYQTVLMFCNEKFEIVEVNIDATLILHQE